MTTKVQRKSVVYLAWAERDDRAEMVPLGSSPTYLGAKALAAPRIAPGWHHRIKRESF